MSSVRERHARAAPLPAALAKLREVETAGQDVEHRAASRQDVGDFFTNKTNLLPWHWWAVRLLLLPLVLVRVLVIVASLLLCYLFSVLLTLDWLTVGRCKRGRPLTGARAWLSGALVRPWLRVVLLCMGFWWVEEEGQPSDSHRGFVSNHVAGTVEGLFLVSRLRTWLLAEQSNFPAPLLPVVLALGMKTFDREKAGRTGEVLADAMKDGALPPTLVFPEGCCSNGDRILSFRAGAFSAPQPLQPLVVRYPNDHLDVAWCLKSPGVFWLFVRMLFSLRLRMRVQWLPVMGPRAEEERMSFMERVRAAMSAASGLKLVAWGLEDVQSAVQAIKEGAGAEVGLLDFNFIRDLVNLHKSEKGAMRNVLKAFASEVKGHSKDSDKSSYINFAEFKGVLVKLRELNKASAAAHAGAGNSVLGGAGTASETPRTPVTEILSRAVASKPSSGGSEEAFESIVFQRLFNLLDVNEDGLLNLRDVIVGLAIMGAKDTLDRDQSVESSPEKHTDFIVRPLPVCVCASGSAVVSSSALSGSPHNLTRAYSFHPSFPQLFAYDLLDPTNERQILTSDLEKVLRMAWPHLTPTRIAEISFEPSRGLATISKDSFFEWALKPETFDSLRQAFAMLTPL